MLPFCWGNILPAHLRGSFKDMPILQLYSTGGQAPAHCSYKPEQSYFGFSTIIHRTLLVTFKNPDLLNAFSVLFCQLYFDAMQEHLCFCYSRLPPHFYVTSSGMARIPQLLFFSICTRSLFVALFFTFFKKFKLHHTITIQPFPTYYYRKFSRYFIGATFSSSFGFWIFFPPVFVLFSRSTSNKSHQCYTICSTATITSYFTPVFAT